MFTSAMTNFCRRQMALALTEGMKIAKIQKARDTKIFKFYSKIWKTNAEFYPVLDCCAIDVAESPLLCEILWLASCTLDRPTADVRR